MSCGSCTPSGLVAPVINPVMQMHEYSPDGSDKVMLAPECPAVAMLPSNQACVHLRKDAR